MVNYGAIEWRKVAWEKSREYPIMDGILPTSYCKVFSLSLSPPMYTVPVYICVLINYIYIYIICIYIYYIYNTLNLPFDVLRVFESVWEQCENTALVVTICLNSPLQRAREELKLGMQVPVDQQIWLFFSARNEIHWATAMARLILAGSCCCSPSTPLGIEVDPTSWWTCHTVLLMNIYEDKMLQDL